MEAATERTSLLDELEDLQNELMVQLDDLDQRVCGVLKEWTSSRRTEATPDGTEARTDVAAPASPALAPSLEPTSAPQQDH